MKNTLVTFILLLNCFVIVITKKRQIQHLDVSTSLGTYHGISQYSISGKQYFAFRGMRYALPISNRFDESVLFNESWKGPESVLEYKPDCIGLDNYEFEEEGLLKRSYSIRGEEDCLFINVHTISIETKRPVIFFIHGGAFSYGGPRQYDAQYIMERNVVFVNFGYRLGPLGFFSTGDQVVPGNMGLKDQLVALQWVNKYINFFGGDQNKISLSGIGAGGASVHLMYLSPLTTGLFQNGYSYSGTALAPWVVLSNIPAKSKALAENFQCPTSSSKQMVACLRNVNVNELITASNSIRVFLYNPFMVFGPVVDSYAKVPYLPAHPKKILKNGPFQDLPWISGFTAEDGLYPGAEYLYNQKYVFKLLEKWDFYLPFILFYKTDCPKNASKAIRRAILSFKSRNRRSFSVTLLQMITDRLYIVPALQSAALMANRNKQNVYLYYFMYRGAYSVSELLRGPGERDDVSVSHSDDAAYVYHIHGAHMRHRQRDIQMSDEMLDLAATFADNSTLPESFKMWRPATNHSSLFNYLEISGPKEYGTYTKDNEFMPVIDRKLKRCWI